jgi:hypothetical protein
MTPLWCNRLNLICWWGVYSSSGRLSDFVVSLVVLVVLSSCSFLEIISVKFAREASFSHAGLKSWEALLLIDGDSSRGVSALVSIVLTFSSRWGGERCKHTCLEHSKIQARAMYPSKCLGGIQADGPWGTSPRDPGLRESSRTILRLPMSRPAVCSKALRIMYRRSCLRPRPPPDRANVRTYVPNLSIERINAIHALIHNSNYWL